MAKDCQNVKYRNELITISFTNKSIKENVLKYFKTKKIYSRLNSSTNFKKSKSNNDRKSIEKRCC